MDTCTPAEALFYRKMLRLVGEEKFLKETVEAQNITAKKLCTAFGVRLPSFLDGQPDNSYYSLLGLCISRELSKRVKLLQYNNIDDAVSLLQDSKNIIVLTGAGVSLLLNNRSPKANRSTRYRQASVFQIFVPRTQGCIRSFNISVSAIRRRCLI